jgi:hypothetical protein
MKRKSDIVTSSSAQRTSEQPDHFGKIVANAVPRYRLLGHRCRADAVPINNKDSHAFGREDLMEVTPAF